MPVRTGTEYLESLRDGRRVWLAGERVDDVTTHPALAACARSVADVYDLQHCAEHQNILTMLSPSTGDRVSLAYLEPKSGDDLIRQRKMYEFLVRRAGGVAARLPHHLATVALGLYDIRDLLAEEDPAYAENACRFFEFCREQDQSIGTVFYDPFHQSRSGSRPDYLKVVERRSQGVVVRGAKGVGTQTPYANEILCMTVPRPDLRPDEVLYFAVPADTPGLQFICREPLTPNNPLDHPLAANWDEMDAIVVFDDVLVPWDRIFYMRKDNPSDPTLYGRLLYGAVNVGPWYVLVRMAVKAEVLIGICAAATEYLGTAEQTNAREALADAIVYLETMRSFILAAEAKPLRSASGLALPDPVLAQAARVFAIENYPRIIHLIRELCGASILTAPGRADLDNPQIAAWVDRYYVGDDPQAQDRFRMLKLAWEYACDSFGSRQLLFEMFNVTSLATNKQRLTAAYDVAPHIALAKRLAGITQE